MLKRRQSVDCALNEVDKALVEKQVIQIYSDCVTITNVLFIEIHLDYSGNIVWMVDSAPWWNCDVSQVAPGGVRTPPRGGSQGVTCWIWGVTCRNSGLLAGFGG